MAKLTPILVQATERRAAIRNKALDGVKAFFPLESSRYTLHVEDVKLDPQEYSSKEQKQALLEGRSLTEPIKGVVVLKDKEGKVITKSRQTTLLNLPWFTERHTFLVDGNEYSIANQVRLRPGIYTRRRGNEELESQFNLVKKGGNFSLAIEAQTGRLLMKMGGANINLYPTLRALGVSHGDIAEHWGHGLADANKAHTGEKVESEITKLYHKLVPEYRRSATTHEARVGAVREWFTSAKLDPEVVQRNLGVSHDSVQPATLLKASQKLVNVYKQAQDVDDRDSLEFKRVHSVDDFIKERISLAGRDLRRKISTKLDHAGHEPELKQVMPASLFTSAVKDFVVNSNLSAVPTNYNPMEVIDISQKVTPLGEGGIGDIRAVPYEARQLHHSHLGVIDPIRTSESEAAGVDNRASIFTHRDEHGNLYTPLRDAKTRKIELIPVGKAATSVVAFPRQKLDGKDYVDALVNGEIKSVNPKDVHYEIFHPAAMYSPATNLVPFIESMQGNRALMAAKMQTQALALKDKEKPHVMVASYRPGRTMEQEFGEMTVPVAPVSGKIEKIDDEYIYIKPHAKKEKTASDELVKVKYDTHFPLGAKSYLHNELKIKAGDEVKENQHLAESNYTVGGTLALGKNLKTGLMAYRGLNSNDAIILSESGAKKLTSVHMYREKMDLEAEHLVGKEKHRTYFGSKYTAAQYANLDEDGVVKKGVRLEPGDLVFAVLGKAVMSPEAAMLGKLHKSLVKPYRDAGHTWEHEFPGEVIDVVKTPKSWALTVRSEEPMVVGDKMAGRHGNKGIVSRILPDDEMVRDEKGDPLDVLYTSAGVISRINPSQVLEMAVAKVADKTGKPIVVDQFPDKNNVEWAKKLLKEHGLTDKETVFDPVTGKKIPGILVGPQYYYKLMKTTTTNYAARGIGTYDVNEQPTKGGVEGAKGLGRMEFAGLIAHNARNILKENSLIRSQRNDEFWRRLQLGLPPPAPKTTFAYDKFGHLLTGMGVKMDKSGTRISLGPLTDKSISEMSTGKIERPAFLRAKDLRPETGGLFDPALTGGTHGEKWTHIELNEPVVNPTFLDPVRHLLGMTGPELKKAIADHGGSWVKSQLKKIDVPARKEQLRKDVKTLRGANLDKAVKQLKYLEALEKQDLTPHEAYVISKIPVVPPASRPVVPNPRGDLIYGDANYLYRDLMLANDKLKTAKEDVGTADVIAKARAHLHDATSAVFGLADPVSPQNAARNVKGFMRVIAGVGSPKTGFFQGKLIRRQLDLTGRSTIAPDVNLGMEEIGLPEDMLWTTYEPFIVGRLVRRGYSATQAKKMVEDRAPAARDELHKETAERPVIYNRAPSLHRYNIIAAYPKPIPGKTIRLPATWAEPMLGADYDGDAIQIHVPVTRPAIEDAKNMTIPNLLFADKVKRKLFVLPQMEAVIGAYKGTVGGPSSKKVRKFKTREEALAAYKRGDVGINDPVEIG